MSKGLTAHPFWYTSLPSEWFGSWLDVMHSLHINYVRVDTDYQGRQTDAQILDLIALANARSMRIKFTLARIATKPWAAPEVNVYCTYAAHLAQLIGASGHSIAIWNEPNDAGFWINPNPIAYANLVDLAYGAIKSVNPAVYVNGGEILFNDYPYRRAFLASHPRMDDYTFHPYTNDFVTTDRHDHWYSFQDTLTDTITDLNAAGYTSLPLIITEFGWFGTALPLAAANMRSAIALIAQQPRILGAMAFELGESYVSTGAGWAMVSSSFTPSAELIAFASYPS